MTPFDPGAARAPRAPRDDIATLAATAAGLGMRELVQRCLLAAAERSHLSLPRAPVLGRLPRFTPPRGIPAFTSRTPA